MEAGKARLSGNTKRQAGSREVETLREENEQLKQLVVELALKNRVLKKKCTWFGERVGGLMCYTQTEKMEIIHLVEEFRPASEAHVGRVGCAAQHVLPVV